MPETIDQRGSDSGSDTSKKIEFPTGKIDLSESYANSTSGEDLDNKIKYQVEENYRKIVDKVIEISREQVKEEGDKKRGLRKYFTVFFPCFIGVQFAALIALLFVKGFIETFSITEMLLTTYIVSVFVETLGVIAAMVAFIFSSKEEVSVIDTLNAAIENYQKLSEKGNKKESK